MEVRISQSAFQGKAAAECSLRGRALLSEGEWSGQRDTSTPEGQRSTCDPVLMSCKVQLEAQGS